MGSTVSNTTFKSFIKESVEINGIKQEAINEKSISNVSDYSHRILTLAENSTSTLLTLGSSNVAGQVNKDSIQYVRITNLDDENSLRLVINLVDAVPAAAGSFHLELKPLKSHLVSTKSSSIVAAAGNFTEYNTISTIQAVTPTGSSIDVELFFIVS